MILKVLKIAPAFRRVQFENFQNHEYLLLTNCTRRSCDFFIYSTFNKIASFTLKLKRYSYGVQFGINCTALDQSKLSNFVECTIKMEIVTRQWGRDRGSELSIFPTYIAVVIWCFGITKYLKGGKIFHLYFSVSFNLGIMSVIMMSHHLFSQLPKSSQSIPCLLLVASSAL